MGKWAVPNVVEQGGGQRVAGSLGGHPLPIRQIVVNGAETGEQPSHHVCRPERMGKSGVVRPGVGEAGEAKLPHATKSLQFAGFQQFLDDHLLGGLEADQTEDRITQYQGESSL
jgi:hypothetical protein